MALAVREMLASAQDTRPVLVADDRRPYRCDGQRADHGKCKRRIGDIEPDRTLLISCERCGQEHEFTLVSKREKTLEAQISALLALLAYVSYDGSAAP